jgi:hypothetical protein
MLLALSLVLPVRAASLPAPQEVTIPLPGAGLFGSTLDMPALLYRPAGDGPFPVLLFSHGRAGSTQERHQLKHPLGRSQIAYWLGKGFIIVAPIRPGYGNTGGGDPEYHSAHMLAPGQCSGHPDYRHTAEAGGAAVQAAIRWIARSPGVRASPLCWKASRLAVCSRWRWVPARRLAWWPISILPVAPVAIRKNRPDKAVSHRL